MLLDKWDSRWLEFAKVVSTWSKDPSTKVGAVIADGKKFISLGYNGLPSYIQDTDERLNNRELKYKIIIHGEVNAMHAAERSIAGCTLYTVPFMPCSVCASQVIQRGIMRVVSYVNDNPRWQEAFALSTELFLEAGVELILVDELHNIIKCSTQESIIQ